MFSNSDTSVDRRSVLSAIGAAGALAATGGVAAAATPGREPTGSRDELLVGVADDAALGEVADRALAAVADALEVVHRNERLGYFSIAVPDGGGDVDLESWLSLLRRVSGVAYAERDATYETQVAPNDPRYDDQYAPQLVNAPTAWDTTFGSADVTVAIVDEGVQASHPDLQGQFPADPGRDFADDDADSTPDQPSSEDHGTHVAGCAGATTDNAVGVAGISDSTLINARVLDESGTGSLADVADGVQWATDQGADVINLSLAGGRRQTLHTAVSYAVDNGALVVCAAGNSAASSVSYPAAYAECVAVSAIGPDDELATFSNHGPAVDVAAPGVNVLSTVPTDDYAIMSGTSMAAPVASGVAALALAADPSLSVAGLRERLTDSAVDVGLSPDEQGAGRVDAGNAVASAGADPCGDVVTADATGSLHFWQEAYFEWTASHDDPCSVTIALDTEPNFDLFVTTDGRQPSWWDHDLSSAGDDGSESITVGDLAPGQTVGVQVNPSWRGDDYTLSVTESGSGATDGGGLVRTD